MAKRARLLRISGEHRTVRKQQRHDCVVRERHRAEQLGDIGYRNRGGYDADYRTLRSLDAVRQDKARRILRAIPQRTADAGRPTWIASQNGEEVAPRNVKRLGWPRTGRIDYP